MKMFSAIIFRWFLSMSRSDSTYEPNDCAKIDSNTEFGQILSILPSLTLLLVSKLRDFLSEKAAYSSQCLFVFGQNLHYSGRLADHKIMRRK
jgi:hypothetical protein